MIPDKLYQVRGFDIANMTFIRSDNGWIIIDVTTTDAAAKAGYDLIKKHVADLPVQGVIFTHPHGDHYGGIAAVKEASSKKDFDIIAGTKRKRAGRSGYDPPCHLYVWFAIATG